MHSGSVSGGVAVGGGPVFRADEVRDVAGDQLAVLPACPVEELLAGADLLGIAAGGGLVEGVQGGGDLAGGLQGRRAAPHRLR